MAIEDISNGWRLQNKQRRQLATQEASSVQVEWELTLAHLHAQDWAAAVPRLETLIACASRLLTATGRLAALAELKPLIEAPEHDTETAARLAHNAGREHHAS